MKTQMCLLPVAVLAVILTGSASRAAVIFNSTTTPVSDYAYIAGPVPADNEESIGQSFTTGGSSVTLSSVALSMIDGTQFNDPITPSGNFFVSLYDATGDGSSPGASLLALSGSANPATTGAYTYTGSYLLAANTTYYIVAGVSSGNGVYEWGSHDSQDSGTVGYSDSFDGGATWNTDNTPPGTVFTDATFNMLINGDITAVPEPAEWGWAGCALLGLVCIGSRRRWSPTAHQN